MEHGGRGGRIAAPVAMKIVRGYFGQAADGTEAVQAAGAFGDDHASHDAEAEGKSPVSEEQRR